MGYLRFFGILIMGVCGFFVMEFWDPRYSNWYVRANCFIGFFIGLLMLVEGIAGEIRNARRKSQSEPPTASKK